VKPPDIPADAHLLAALRHAPDHGVTPPPGLSRQILAQARQAAAPTPAAPWFRRWRQGLQALDRRLSQPALTAAVATVALATVLGLMWRDGPPVDSGPDLAEATVPASVPMGTVPMASAPEVREKRAPEMAVVEAAPSSPPVPANAPPAVRPKPPVRALKAPAAPPPQAPPPPLTAAAAEPAPAADLERKLESTQANQAPMLAAEPASPPPQPLAAVLDALRDQPATVQVLPAPGRSPHAGAPPEALRRRLAAHEPRAAARAPQPFTDQEAAGRQWLADVTRAAEGRWQLMAALAVDAGGPGLVIVQVGEATAGRLLLSDSGVLWWPGPTAGPAWRADLDVATLQALRAQAPRP